MVNATLWPGINVAAISWGGKSKWGRYSGPIDWFDVDAWKRNKHE